MINPTYPGVYVQELSSGARAIAGVSTSTTAFIGMTQRGPVNKPTRIFNFREYDSNFGSVPGSGEMANQVQLYFDNGGGEAWITRIADGAVAAKVTLRNEAGDDVLELTAKERGTDGNNIRVRVDYDTPSPESTFNMTIYRQINNLDGSVEERDVETLTSVTMDPDSASSVVTAINNQSSLLEAQYSAGLVALAASHSVSGLIFPQLVGDMDPTIAEKFSSANGQFRLKIEGHPDAVVDVVLPTNAAELTANIETGIDTAINALGLSGTVTSAVTLVNLIAAANGRVLNIVITGAQASILPSTTNDVAGPLMLGSSQGGIEIGRFSNLRPAPSGYVSRSHIIAAGVPNFTKIFSFANLAKAVVTGIDLTDSSTSTHPTINPTYPIAAGEMRIGSRFSPVAPDNSFGSFTNVAENLGALASAITENTSEMWSAEVHGLRLVLTPNFGNENADTSAALTTSPTNIAAANTIFASAADPQSTKAYSVGVNNGPALALTYQDGHLSGDNGNIPLVADYRVAFDIMERDVDLFNLMVLPRAQDSTGSQSDAARKVAFNAASAFCAKERAFLLVDPPSDVGPGLWEDASTAATGADALRIGLETRNSAVYWPRLKKADGSHQDPAGPMAGLMARTDGARGVWKAAAGVEATIRGVSGVEYMMSDPENGVINPKAVNALRVFPDGILSWGARTLIGFNSSGNIDDKYIPVRRTMLFIEESLYRGLRFAVFEPNDEPLWAQIRLAAGSFMNSLFRQGAFAGSKASDAYYVICDSTTTTETDKNLGIVNVVVAFAPLKPAEFVILTVTQIAGQTPT